LKQHDRWLLARTLLLRKLDGRRSTSRLPELIELVLSRPLISAGMIAKELGVTPRAAQNLVAELGLREATGRGRYRAWGRRRIRPKEHAKNVREAVRKFGCPPIRQNALFSDRMRAVRRRFDFRTRFKTLWNYTIIRLACSFGKILS